jgi:hypothetical protein
MNDKLPKPLPAIPMSIEVSPASVVGSRDGAGAGDHDEPLGGFRVHQFSTVN